MLQTLYGHKDGVLCLTVLDNGDLVSGSVDKTILIWNTTNGSVKQNLTGHTNFVRGLKQLSTDILASGSNDNTIIWTVNSGS